MDPDTKADIAKGDAVIATANYNHSVPYFEAGAWHVCAWCHPGWHSTDEYPTTHGICARHAKEMRCERETLHNSMSWDMQRQRWVCANCGYVYERK